MRIKLEIQIFLGLRCMKKGSNYKVKGRKKERKERKEEREREKEKHQPAPGALGSGNPICT